MPTNLLNAKHLTTEGAHREKEKEAGSLDNHLINWYCLVAKPITRKEWPSIPAAEAAVDK